MQLRYYINFILNMKNPIIVLAIVLICSVLAKQHPEAKLPFLEYCNYYQYPAQAHVIETSDGYLLTFYRIQKKKTTIRSGLQPIYLQHGLLDSSDTWIINDEDKAPAFILANLGFDVWLGNSRGNKHSRKHTTLNPDKGKQFWEFTFESMADYDLPAAFKYINAKTGSKIHYIGHSQGTIQMHIALAKNNPVVESLIDKYFGFGPVAYVNNQESPIMKLLDKSGLVEWYNLRGIHEFMPSPGWFQTDIGVIFCAEFGKICADVLAQVMDANPELDNYDRYDVLVGHAPSGTSVTNMKHWKQLLDTGKFQSFDYGTKKANQQHYGQDTPPEFKIGNIRVPIRLFAGTSDLLADIKDVQRFWGELPKSVKEFYRIYDAGHCTFIWGKDVTPWMNDIFSYIL